MKYKIGTTFKFKHDLKFKGNTLREQYDVVIYDYNGIKYQMEWTALMDNVEGRSIGSKWRSVWSEANIDNDLERYDPIPPVTLPEELFTL